MKVIDILNKINNGEEVPEKIRFNDIEFEYDTRQEEYNHQNDDGYYETLLYAVMNTHFISRLLRAEVEVIEENKEIEELNKISYDEFKYAGDKRRFDLTNIEYDKINELVRAVNKLNKEREEK